MDDTHDLLTKAYMEYFKENEHFEDPCSIEHTEQAEHVCENKKISKIPWTKSTRSPNPLQTKKLAVSTNPQWTYRVNK